jgi:hypothetical protein
VLLDWDRYAHIVVRSLTIPADRKLLYLTLGVTMNSAPGKHVWV